VNKKKMMQLQPPPANQAMETSLGRLLAPVRANGRITHSISSKILKSDVMAQTTKEPFVVDCCHNSHDDFDVTNTELEKMSFYKYNVNRQVRFSNHELHYDVPRPRFARTTSSTSFDLTEDHCRQNIQEMVEEENFSFVPGCRKNALSFSEWAAAVDNK